VAQGFSQIPGVDYFDTFAPVARLASIQTVLASENLETGQIDIKGAYLNGELTDNEHIYMCQPLGYAQGSFVCNSIKLSMDLNNWAVIGTRSW
jgi:hypothetical protein